MNDHLDAIVAVQTLIDTNSQGANFVFNDYDSILTEYLDHKTES